MNNIKDDDKQDFTTTRLNLKDLRPNYYRASHDENYRQAMVYLISTWNDGFWTTTDLQQQQKKDK
jgi:hypothetical protein